MDSVINSFFNTIESGLIMPVANGIWGILPVILYVAIKMIWDGWHDVHPHFMNLIGG